MTEQQPLRLARHFQVFIEDQVAQGRYETPTKVVEDALRLLQHEEEKRAALASALVEGEESGDPTTLDMSEIAATARKRVQAPRAA
jgi:antitoxin ParD1/3/4